MSSVFGIAAMHALPTVITSLIYVYKMDAKSPAIARGFAVMTIVAVLSAIVAVESGDSRYDETDLLAVFIGFAAGAFLLLRSYRIAAQAQVFAATRRR